MPFKDIQVHVGAADYSRKRIELATQLAGLHKAHLTGVHPMAPPKVPAYIEVQLAGSFWDTMEKVTKEIAGEAEKLFKEICTSESIESDWHAVPGLPGAVLTEQARTSDLMIAGQSDPKNPSAYAEVDLPADIAIGAGRPVLLVPYAGTFGPSFKTVLVAWNGSRESARAVHDAMPFLIAADKVHVSYAKSGRDDKTLGDLPGSQLALHLARHGVSAESTPVPGGKGHAGELLLSATSDLGADLIVMGPTGVRKSASSYSAASPAMCSSTCPCRS